MYRPHAKSADADESEETSVPVKTLPGKHRTTAEQKNLHQALQAVMGVNLCAIPTIGIETALVIASEIGADLSRFPTEAQFCSWLALAPPTNISGGKSLPGAKPKTFNRAGQALRQAALNARRSQTFIGACHRGRLTRMDTAKAVTPAHPCRPCTLEQEALAVMQQLPGQTEQGGSGSVDWFSVGFVNPGRSCW